MDENTLRRRLMEWMIGFMSASTEAYAERLTPLLVSPGCLGGMGVSGERSHRRLTVAQACARHSRKNLMKRCVFAGSSRVSVMAWTSCTA
jgi:hypothetical protein